MHWRCQKKMHEWFLTWKQNSFGYTQCYWSKYYSWWNKRVYIYIQSYKWSIQWWVNLPTPGGPDLVELRAPYSTNFDRGSWRLCEKASKFRCATIHLSQQKWSWKEDRCMTAIFNWCSHHPPLRIFYLWKFAYVHKKKFEEKLQCFSRSLCSAFARHLNEDLFWSILCPSSKLWLKLKVTSSRFWLKSSPKSQHRCQARDLLKYSICEICSFLQLVFFDWQTWREKSEYTYILSKNQWNNATWNLRLIATHNGIYGLSAPKLIIGDGT